jgi:two-component system phosphate regulon response regulator PhoB
MDKARILVIEDQLDIQELISHNLKSAGYEVLAAAEGQRGLALARVYRPNLVILDLILPDLGGFEVCDQLKESAVTADIPIIILTARGEEVDRILGLELGADDYMVKPFSPRELLLRIRAILRRTRPEADAERKWKRNGLEVDLAGYRVSVDQEEVRLTATEFKLMAEFIHNQGKVLSRDRLLAKVWGYQFDGCARTVDTCIRRLRSKFGPYADIIETVRGVGYRLRDPS